MRRDEPSDHKPADVVSTTAGEPSREGLDRRRMIKRAVAAGAVAWSAPLVLESLVSPAAAATNDIAVAVLTTFSDTVDNSKSTTTASITATSGARLYILVFRASEAADSITGITGPFASATQIQSNTFDSSTHYLFAWTAVANTATPTPVTVSFTKKNKRPTYVDVVQVTGSSGTGDSQISAAAIAKSSSPSQVTVTPTTLTNAGAPNASILMVGLDDGDTDITAALAASTAFTTTIDTQTGRKDAGQGSYLAGFYKPGLAQPTSTYTPKKDIATKNGTISFVIND